MLETVLPVAADLVLIRRAWSLDNSALASVNLLSEEI